MLTREEHLTQTFVELADTLVADFDVIDLFALMTERCVALFDAAAAGLLLADPQGTLRLVAATDEATETVELFQLQNHEGPCLDAFSSGESVLIADLAGAQARWPRFVPVATGAGFASVNAFPLRLRDQVLGALNLFGASPTPLAEADCRAAQALADIATISLLQYRAVNDAQTVANQLSMALESRIAIEQAKGVIAEARGVGMSQAFAMLRQHARSHQRALIDVAEQVAAGSLSPDALQP